MPTNYPAALDSFTTKVDGVDDVLAADINNLQDAIRATQQKLGIPTTTTQINNDRAGIWSQRTLLIQNDAGSAPGIGFHAPSTSTAGILKFQGSETAFYFTNAVDSDYVAVKGRFIHMGGGDDVGVYALAYSMINGNFGIGTLVAGSNLRTTAASGFPSDQALPGTWMCQGWIFNSGTNDARATVFRRIS